MPRLYVDMDGTLAQWHELPGPEPLFEQGYFLNLEPIPNMVAAIKDIATNHPEIELHILSAVVDSPYAIAEKNAWLDKFLPEIPADHRIYLPCGADKTLSIHGGIKSQDFLLDDYNHNLSMWVPPTHGIKVVNGVNDRHKSWQHSRVDAAASPSQIVFSILNVMERQIEKEGVSKMANSVPINKNPNEEQAHVYVYAFGEYVAIHENCIRLDTVKGWEYLTQPTYVCTVYVPDGWSFPGTEEKRRMAMKDQAMEILENLGILKQIESDDPNLEGLEFRIDREALNRYEQEHTPTEKTKAQEQSKEQSPDNCLTGDKIRTPRGSFSLTAMSKEEIKAAGFSYHHSSDDGKYDIMTNGTTAYAVSAQQPEKTKPHKAKGLER